MPFSADITVDELEVQKVST